MMRGGVTVELGGLPGCGNASLSRRVADFLSGRSLHAREPTYRLDHGPEVLERTIRKSFHVTREILRHPGYAARSESALRSTEQESLVIMMKMLFNWLLVSSLLRQERRSPGVTLLDQGIFQALWSIGLGGRAAVSSMARALGDEIPMPDAVVVVEASLASVTHRLQLRRGHDSRADGWTDEVASPFARAFALFEDVKNVLAARQSVNRSLRVLPVPNDRAEDLGINASALAAEIASMVERTAA